MSNTRTTKTKAPIVRRDAACAPGTFLVEFDAEHITRWLTFADATELARRVAAGEDRLDVEAELFGGPEEWVPTCSICDGVGHGYPGAGPCPLEDRGYDTDGVWR